MPLAHLWTFYRNFLLPCIAITLFQGVLMAGASSGWFSIMLLWTKLVSCALLGVLFHFSRNDQLYFFYNLGYSRARLYCGALVFDMFIWSTVILIGYLLL